MGIEGGDRGGGIAEGGIEGENREGEKRRSGGIEGLKRVEVGGIEGV